MKTNQWVSSVTVGDALKAKTDITIHIKKQNNLLSSRNFVLIHNSIYKTILGETKKLIEVKKSMKVQTVVEFSVNKVKDKDGKFVDDKRVENSKSESVTESGLDAVLQKQKMDVDDKLKQVQLDSFSVGAIHKIVITVYSTRRARGSSYIQTPEPYHNSRCGLINIKNDDSECF